MLEYHIHLINMLKRNGYTNTSFYRLPLKVQVDMEGALRCSRMIQSVSGKTVWTWIIYANLILICGGEKCKETSSTAANLQGNNGDQTFFSLPQSGHPELSALAMDLLPNSPKNCEMGRYFLSSDTLLKEKLFPPLCDFYENYLIYTFRQCSSFRLQ